jgi:hypothetical protein
LTGGVRVRTLAVADEPAARKRAALAIARALGIAFAEAQPLVDGPRVLPGLFDDAEAQALVAALAAADVTAEAFAVAAAGSTRCGSHPQLGVDVGCSGCTRSICAVCVATQDGRCRDCHARLHKRRRFARLRVGCLLVALVVTGGWALGVRQRRVERTRWRRPLDVNVVLLGERAAPPTVTAAWQEQLPSLEHWLVTELGRYRCGDGAPVGVRLHLGGPLVVDRLPAYLPDDDGLMTRARHAFALDRSLAAIDTRAALAPKALRLYVLLAPRADAATVEGAGEVGGDAGFVTATLDDDPSFALIAVAHELLHCLGASDKYDGAGHARALDGLAEPARGYPQTYAEIMVGEVALAPGRGRNPASLDEVRLGAVTAAEINCR